MPRPHLVLPALVLPMLGSAVVTESPEPRGEHVRWEPVDPWDEVGLLVEDPCLGEAPCLAERQVFVDYDALQIPGQRGGEWIAYDYDEVTRAVQSRELPDEGEVSLAVRLIVSEVGADRLVTNRFALLEAIGILYTVDNRLDPLIYNPEGAATAPAFPGCGPGGTFGSCANPEQYLGMATWRALNPTARYDDVLLEEAVDIAITAWWLQENGYVPDFTEGATNYVHRCGGEAYGMTTWHCDAHVGNTKRDDVAGANPFTGPIVFKGPTVYLDRQGFYGIRESRRLEYDPWVDLDALELDDGLADACEDCDAPTAWDGYVELLPAKFAGADPMAADATIASVHVDPTIPADPVLMERLLRWSRPGR